LSTLADVYAAKSNASHFRALLDLSADGALHPSPIIFVKERFLRCFVKVHDNPLILRIKIILRGTTLGRLLAALPFKPHLHIKFLPTCKLKPSIIP
jgi:hypothetical protein